MEGLKRAGKIVSVILSVILVVFSAFMIFFMVDNWDYTKNKLQGYFGIQTENDNAYAGETMTLADFEAKLTEDGFFVVTSNDINNLDDVTAKYEGLLESAAMRRTDTKDAENTIFVYELYWFTGTEDEAQAVKVWSYTQDFSKTPELGTGEEIDSVFGQVNAEILLDGFCTAILDESDITMKDLENNDLMFFDFSKVDSALTI